MDAIEKSTPQHSRSNSDIRYLLPNIITTACLIVACLVAYALFSPNPDLYETNYNETFHQYIEPNQYALLGDAFLHGHLDLDLYVNPDLAAADNPYDFSVRYDAGSESSPIYWDHAFYNGKYYSYFGCVPALLLYMPYEMVTGQFLSTPLAVLVCTIAYLCIMSAFIHAFLKRCWGSKHDGSYEVLAILSVAALSNVAYIITALTFYSIPYICSMLFTTLALLLWLFSSQNLQNGESCRHNARAQLAFGSLCMALNIGCRPQFIIASLLAFPIFYQEIFLTRKIFSRRYIDMSMAALLPFIAVGMLQGWYNYARFGSFTDFGASYNLTGFNMTEYSQEVVLTYSLVTTYLFGPIDFSHAFPFFESYICDWSFGFAPAEPFFGGYFLLMPIAFVLIRVHTAWKSKDSMRGVRLLVVLNALIAVVLLVIDAKVAGIAERYFSDFGYFMAFDALIALAFMAKAPLRKSKPVVVVLLVLTYTNLFFTHLSPTRYYSLAISNPPVWDSIVRHVQSLGLKTL